MRKQSAILMLVLAAALLTLAVLSGCDPYKVEGNRIENLPPTISWAFVPQDSMAHSANPLLKWFGLDGDGQVIDYQYVVLLEEEVETYGGINQIVSDFPDSIEWISLGNITSAVIPLYASEDTSEYVDQFVFLRCLDDSDAYSEIIYLFLSRNNHPPTCAVMVPEDPQWCLPDTNEFWHGINVSWSGHDSLDYEFPPDFIWHVRLYGPFSSVPDSSDTLAQYLYGVAVDPQTGVDTVTFTSISIDDLETGWYILYAKNFDDAHVASIPALGFFEVYEPNWIRHPDETKDILIVNQSRYLPLVGNLPMGWEDSVRIFYENVLADAGFTEDQWDWTDDQTLTHSMLYNYRMVIVDDIDWNGNITGVEDELSLYLDVGGKLWVTGRFSFSNVSNQTGRVDYGLDDEDHPLPYTYMGLSFAYFPPSSLTFAEFKGARQIVTGFPNLSVDTLKIQGLHSPGDFDYALPRVEYLSKRIEAQTLFLFEAIDPYSPGTFHGFPVAIRNETATFKTSYFSFPLFFIQYNQASQVVDQMLTWFLSDSR
jgi:hypothetical protein